MPMAGEPELRDKLALVVGILRQVLEQRVRAIQHGVERVAVESCRKFLEIPAYSDANPSERTHQLRKEKECVNPERRLQLPLPAIPPHLTFEVSTIPQTYGGGFMGNLECRKHGKVAYYRFNSQASGLVVLGTLAERGTVSSTEKQVLVTHIRQSLLPGWTEEELEWGASIKAAQDWIRPQLESHMSG
jgi:hypothetical protein